MNELIICLQGRRTELLTDEEVHWDICSRELFQGHVVHNCCSMHGAEMAAIPSVAGVYLRVYIEISLCRSERTELQQGIIVKVFEGETEFHIQEDGFRSVCDGLESVQFALTFCNEVWTESPSAGKLSTSHALYLNFPRAAHVIQNGVNHMSI